MRCRKGITIMSPTLMPLTPRTLQLPQEPCANSGVVTLIRYCLASKFSYRQQLSMARWEQSSLKSLKIRQRGALLRANMLFHESPLLTGINLFLVSR